LLDALAPRDDVRLALLTGNLEPGARIKLAYFDLWRYFPWGAFGEHAVDRTHLVPVALQRAHDAGIVPANPRDVLVVGDTPQDIACAHAAGAMGVGVATGPFTAAELRASGADEVFEDLGDTARFLSLLAPE
jgi:phosphoglycolate phosphatase-like HAD superfamily hydrolase